MDRDTWKFIRDILMVLLFICFFLLCWGINQRINKIDKYLKIDTNTFFTK
jgi:hypothetical protein